MSHTLGPDTRIVYLANNPTTERLDFEAEANAIREELERRNVADELLLHTHMKASTDDIHNVLQEAPNARVLHLAGHGGKTAGLLSVDPDGHAVGIKGTALANVLKAFPNNIQLVVLSACELGEHAKALAKVVPCVVGTSTKLADAAARRFARALYKELAAGASIQKAFERATAVTQLDRADPLLTLETRYDVDPHELKLVSANPTQVQQRRKADAEAKAAEAFNGHDDIVLFGNITGTWESKIPHTPDVEPRLHEIKLRAGSWQTKYPLNHSLWDSALREVLRAVEVADRSRKPRVHIAAKLPFSLGAAMGAALEQQNREVVFYQQSPESGGASDQRTWQPWGPGLTEMRNASPKPVFREFKSRTVNEPVDVAIMCGISRPIDRSLAEDAIDAVDGQIEIVPVKPINGPSASAIDLTTVDKAASELSELLQQLPTRFPLARAFHLFYCGPVALLTRAVGRVHLLSKPLYFYEWFSRTPTGPQYVRTVELREQRLVIDGRHSC